jgi:hypothetical protein
MSLGDIFNTYAVEPDSALAPSGELLREMAGLEAEKWTLTLPASNCTEVAKSDGYYYERPFYYGVVVEFEDRLARDRFLEDPNARDNIHTIQRTVENGLQETLQLESDRDASGAYGNPDDDSLVRGINEGTRGDLGVVLPELESVLKSAYPDAGIKSISIDDLQGADNMCARIEGPYASNLLDAMPYANTQTAPTNKFGL